MRLSTDEARDEDRALETIAAAAAAGVTVFDTAHAYGRHDGELGHNERLVARALRRCGAESSARIVTKGGMARTGGGWIPDGRAKAVLADCEASLVALDGLAIDLYLIHAPDPRAPWRTTLRALARIRDGGLARRVGVCNVNRRQLDEALELAPLAAVQVALGPFDDRALRGGVVERCAEAGIAVIAHSPLGGPKRVGRLSRNVALAGLATAVDATPAEVALAWLLGVSPVVVAIPGARRPETARSAAAAARLTLDAEQHAAAGHALGLTTSAGTKAARTAAGADVVVVMGIPGAGKSMIAEGFAASGYLRLNRDERGGSLRDVAGALDEALATGAGRVVLDNTYLTRAARNHVVEIAGRHGAVARCIWLDTPLPQAQINLVERLLDRDGSLPGPDRLRDLARREPGLLTPTSQMRTVRELEPPSEDEGLRASSGDRSPAGRTRRDRPPACLWRQLWRAETGGSAPSRRHPRTHRTWSSTGTRTATGRRSMPPPAAWPQSFPDRWRRRCARTPAVRRAAGAGRRCRGSCLRSGARTASTSPARCSSAPGPLTARWRPRSGRGMSSRRDATTLSACPIALRVAAPAKPCATGSCPSRSSRTAVTA
jgi:aryl-alcohol dehydrogenase-like predicted oxidoreductase/predicted kinase